MDSKELETLKELDGPSSLTQARAKRYVTDEHYRADVDKADKEKGTKAGPQLRAIYFGEKPVAVATPVVPPPTAVEVADAVKKFDKARCHDLFVGSRNKNGDTLHAEIASKLDKDEYQQARTAARFFGIALSGPDSGAAVRFAYETRNDRQAKRDARESAAQNAERAQAAILPPGVEKDAQGNIILADEAKFTAWKASKSEHKAAIDFLESQAA
jgi:hypothetical protein